MARYVAVRISQADRWRVVRIAIVTHNVLRGDGQGRVNYEFVRYALERGATVELFADRVDEDLLALGASFTPVNPGFGDVDLLKVWRFRRLTDTVLRDRASEFDAIIACGVVLGVDHDLNVAHFVHGTWLRSPWHASKVRKGIDGAYQWLFSALNARWERSVFSRAKVVGAVSSMVRDELKEIGVDPHRIKVLGNGVDTTEFAPGVVSRAKLGLPEGVPLALFVGDIQSPIKNLDLVLDAMTRVPRLHLAIAGRVGTSPYPAMAQRLGIQDRTHFLDFRSDIADLMRGADFFVLVSRRDSCPLVVLEALASGLPVVTAKTVGNHDLVDGRSGFVIDAPDDLNGLVSALETLTNDERERARLAIEARAVGVENTWDLMAEKYLSVLGLASGQPRAATPAS